MSRIRKIDQRATGRRFDVKNIDRIDLYRRDVLQRAVRDHGKLSMRRRRTYDIGRSNREMSVIVQVLPRPQCANGGDHSRREKSQPAAELLNERAERRIWKKPNELALRDAGILIQRRSFLRVNSGDQA